LHDIEAGDEIRNFGAFCEDESEINEVIDSLNHVPEQSFSAETYRLECKK